MSIAVSALVRSSRAQRLLLACAALAHAGIALALAPWSSVLPTGMPALALLPLLAAAVLAAAAVRRPKVHRIDISGTGELRVTVQQSLCAAPAARLLPGSVVWPVLMVVRWRAPGTRARALLVRRDSVDAGTWRALTVALAVIGRRTRADDNDTINRSGDRAHSDERTGK
jgi:toxin CptA